MRNLFKKSLAICLAIALCLTAMVGLTVSAEDVTIDGTLTTGDVEVEAGATAATVSFALAATDLSEVILSLEASEGATIYDVAAPEGTTDYLVIPNDDKSMVAFATNDVNVVTSKATVNVTVTFAEAAAEDAYTVTAKLDYGMGATNKEELIVIADPAVANITVKAAVEECAHDKKELVGATPAADGVPGKLDYDCPDCDNDDEIDIIVEYSLYSAMQTPDIECTAVTNLIFKTSSGLFPYIGNGTVDEGIVVITHTFADGSTEDIVTTFADAQVTGSTYKWFVGVPGKMMTDNFTATLYTKSGDVWYSAASINASIKTSAMAIVKDASIADKTKKVAANLLVMGAKSQIKFNYNYDNDASKLADAELLANDDYAKYIITTTPTIKKTDENFINEIDMSLVIHQTPDLLLEDSIKFSYKMLTNYYENADSLTDLKLVLSYELADGSTSTETVTDINLAEGSTTKYIASYGVPARYMRKPVSATLYNGETAVAPTVVFSVESLLSTLTAEVDVNLAIAIMNYSDAAEANFSA